MRLKWKIKIALLVILGIAAMTAIVMWLWNWLIPDLFNGPMITFWQALGLLLLSRILFRGFYGMKGKGMHQMGEWKGRFEKMTPEEKEKVRELWKRRCGHFACDEEEIAESKKDSTNNQ